MLRLQFKEEVFAIATATDGKSILLVVNNLAAWDCATCAQWKAALYDVASDRWTPLRLSKPFLGRIRQVPVKTVMLENAGHYPLEQPGLAQMVDAIDSFYREVTGEPVRKQP